MPLPLIMNWKMIINLVASIGTPMESIFKANNLDIPARQLSRLISRLPRLAIYHPDFRLKKSKIGDH
jgi:hypothetical protein